MFQQRLWVYKIMAATPLFRSAISANRHNTVATRAIMKIGAIASSNAIKTLYWICFIFQTINYHIPLARPDP